MGIEGGAPPHTLLAAKKLRIQYRPYPVVGIISPWNFPLILALGDAIPALQAGAAVVIKPSEFTPLGLAEVVKAWKEEIGGPDVFDCVHRQVAGQHDPDCRATRNLTMRATLKMRTARRD